jgi:hypothetical protein
MTMPDPGLIPTSSVGLLDIYTRQIEMNAQLGVIHEQLKSIPDHEKRLRELEQVRARMYGAALTLGGLAGGAAAWIALIVQHHH